MDSEGIYVSENKEKVYPECEKLASHEQELNTIRNFLATPP